jgi:hypothetical protein
MQKKVFDFKSWLIFEAKRPRLPKKSLDDLPLPEETPKRFEPDPGMSKNYDRGARSFGSYIKPEEPKVRLRKTDLEGKECVAIVLQYLPQDNFYRGFILPSEIFFPGGIAAKNLDNRSLLPLSDVLFTGTREEIFIRYREERADLKNFYQEFYLEPKSAKNPQELIKAGDIVKGVAEITIRGQRVQSDSLFLFNYEKIDSIDNYRETPIEPFPWDHLSSKRKVLHNREAYETSKEYFNFSFGDAYGSETSVACTITVSMHDYGKNISTKDFRFFAYTEDGKKTMLPFYEMTLVHKRSSGYVFLSNNIFYYTDGSFPIEIYCYDKELSRENIKSTIIDFLEDTTESHPNQYKFYPKSLRKAWFMMALNRLFNEYSFDYSGFEKEEAMEDIKRNFRKVFGEVIEKDQIDISPSGYKKMRFAYIGREASLALENLGLKLPGDIPREDQKFSYDLKNFFPFYPDGKVQYVFIPFAEFLSPIIWEFATKEDLALRG